VKVRFRWWYKTEDQMGHRQRFAAIGEEGWRKLRGRRGVGDSGEDLFKPIRGGRIKELSFPRVIKNARLKKKTERESRGGGWGVDQSLRQSGPGEEESYRREEKLLTKMGTTESAPNYFRKDLNWLESWGSIERV